MSVKIPDTNSLSYDYSQKILKPEDLLLPSTVIWANKSVNARLYRPEGGPPTNIRYFHYADTVQLHFHV